MKVLKSVVLLAALAALLIVIPLAMAQAPGYTRFVVVDTGISVVSGGGANYYVSDGYVDLPSGVDWYQSLITAGKIKAVDSVVQVAGPLQVAVPTAQATATPGVYVTNSSVANSVYVASGDVNLHDQTLINPFPAIVAGAASGNVVEILGTTGVFTDGTNTENFLNIDAAIGNATGGTNVVNAIGIDAITGDAQVTENAIKIGAGWDNDIILQNGEGIENATDASIKFTDGANTLMTIVDAGAVGNLLLAGKITDTPQASAATADYTLTATSSVVQLSAVASCGTSSITAGAAGQVLIIIGPAANTVTFTDTGTLKLGGNRELSANDTLSLIGDGTNWNEIGFVNN